MLMPDSGAPGADEAFKSVSLSLFAARRCLLFAVVSKAFQVLSDDNLRAAFDSNPHGDPTQRGGGVSGRSASGFRPGFANGGGGFQGDMNPEDLFNMFFGGGGGGMGNGFGGANGSFS